MDRATDTRRGRRTAINSDLSGPGVVTNARTMAGWLLSMHRLYAADRQLRTLRNLAAALSVTEAPPLEHTTLLHWEKAHCTVPARAMQRYEQVLGTCPGELAAMVHTLDHTRPRGRRQLRRRGDLLEKCLGGDLMTAVEWSELTTDLAGSHRYLPTTHWDELTRRLLAEMSVSIGWRYLLRLSALEQLHRHRQTANSLVTAIGNFIAEPDCQLVVDPVALLSSSPTETATKKLLAMMSSPRNQSEQRGALIAWAARAPGGATLNTLLASRALDLLTDTASGGPLRTAATDLLATLPPTGLSARLQHHVQSYRAANRMLPSTTTDTTAIDEIIQAVTKTQTGRHEEDVITGHLIRQALFSTDSDLQVVSVNVLRASPFRQVVAGAAESTLRNSSPQVCQVTTIALINLLGSLGDVCHRGTLEAIMCRGSTPQPVISAAATALAHLPGTTNVQIWLRIIAAPVWSADSVQRATLYALGMNHDRRGLELVRSSAMSSPGTANGARWWLRLPATVTSSATR